MRMQLVSGRLWDVANLPHFPWPGQSAFFWRRPQNHPRFGEMECMWLLQVQKCPLVMAVLQERKRPRGCLSPSPLLTRGITGGRN